VIDGRRTELRSEALARGERLRARKPRVFVRRIARAWRG
jgi:hypothetical protein